MLRGTRLLFGKDALVYSETCTALRELALGLGLEEAIVPAIWEYETFENKVGDENRNMMWKFQDKGDRSVCLIPEVTGIFQEWWNETGKKINKEKRIFYISRCYRYERPQAGRYREFTQFGVEFLGSDDVAGCKELLKKVIGSFDVDAEFTDSVKRGLNYYTEEGFEVKVEALGAQKQIAGGGKYPEGVGFAIGIERLIMAMGV